MCSVANRIVGAGNRTILQVCACARVRPCECVRVNTRVRACAQPHRRVVAETDASVCVGASEPAATALRKVVLFNDILIVASKVPSHARTEPRSALERERRVHVRFSGRCRSQPTS